MSRNTATLANRDDAVRTLSAALGSVSGSFASAASVSADTMSGSCSYDSVKRDEKTLANVWTQPENPFNGLLASAQIRKGQPHGQGSVLVM